MRWIQIRSLLILALCFFGWTIAGSSDAAVPKKAAAQKSGDAPANDPKPAANDAPEATAGDGDAEEKDEPAPIPAMAENDDDPAAEEDAPASGTSKGAMKEASEATKPDAPDGDEEPAAGPEEEPEPLAPPPPGGSLLEKIKQASTPVDRPQPAEFHGLRAGLSTVDDLEKAWGAPLSVTQQKEVLRRVYRRDARQRVEVLCLRDVVQSIVVHYDQNPRWAQLAGEIGVDKIEPADVADEFGEVVGAAVPEHGILAVFKTGGGRRVAQLIYDPIDAQTFVERALQRMGRDYSGCQKDLDLALVIDPQCARAYWLRARALKAVGQIDSATKAAEAALQLEPKNAQYGLTYGALLADGGQFARAIEQTKQALPHCALRPELKASAMTQLADQMSAGPARDYKEALPLHMQAIKLAEPLVKDRRRVVRDIAQETVIAAHLSAARNIAWGNWKMKKKMVPAWLNRAEELANEAAPDEGAPIDMRLRVCREALTACVGMEGDLDPTPWIERALTLTAPVLTAASDPLRRRQIEWELGTALYDALQVYHATGDVQQAMKYGTLAVAHLEAGAEERHLEPVEGYLLGRLYYRMGAVYALHVKAPEQAVAWFERAVPLLERPLPAAAQVDVGRHGESFVSMAVSYWAGNSHEEAVRLTRQGMKLMEQAVKEGTLEEEALRVPYTNLATMHRFLGDDEQAEAFGAMAAKLSDTLRK